jgi:uncharacterized protein (DUF1778 family)
MPARKGGGGEPAMKARGMTKVVVWLNAEEYELVASAAARNRARLSTYVRNAAYHTAQKSAAEARRAGRP